MLLTDLLERMLVFKYFKLKLLHSSSFMSLPDLVTGSCLCFYCCHRFPGEHTTIAGCHSCSVSGPARYTGLAGWRGSGKAAWWKPVCTRYQMNPDTDSEERRWRMNSSDRSSRNTGEMLCSCKNIIGIHNDTYMRVAAEFALLMAN